MSNFIVSFENHPPLEVEASFPSLAARLAGERLRLRGDRACSVREPDGTLTHWRVTLLESWYSRPDIDMEKGSLLGGPSSLLGGSSSLLGGPSS